MLHCFTVGGTKLVYDVHSHSLHEVDDLAWTLLSRELYREPRRALDELAGDGFAEADIREALEEIDRLRREEMLCTPDPFSGYEPGEFQVKALCLNVAHNCNLACRYCFANASDAGDTQVLMPLSTAVQAVDFLFANAGARRHLEIDFFGGEPLLNFSVIRETVEYARRRGEAEGKAIGFTVTTNGVLLDDRVGRYLLENGINVVLSCDGRPEVHNRLRRTRGGEASHETVLAHILNYLAMHRRWPGPKGYCYVRGTFTRYNLDFAQDFLYLAGLGIEDVSLEPVVAKPEEDHALRWSDVQTLSAEYERLAEAYVAFARDGKPVRFFHFEIDLDDGPCLPKLLTGCGAGHSYLAVTAHGDIYPCHQFIGRRDYLMGHVRDGRLRQDIVDLFRGAHVYAKPKCRNCWAKFLCSGGCQAHCEQESGSIFQPPDLACRLMQKRLECALYVRAKLADLTTHGN